MRMKYMNQNKKYLKIKKILYLNTFNITYKIQAKIHCKCFWAYTKMKKLFFDK